MVKGVMNYALKDISEYYQSVRSSKGIFWFYRLLTLIYIIGIIILTIIGTPTYSLITMCSALAIIILLYIFMVITVKKAPEKEFAKLAEKYNNKPVYFEFFNEKFNIETKDDDAKKSQETVEYSSLEYAIETDNYFYFAKSGNNGYIFKKSAITEGTVKELEDILKNSLSDKFKVKWFKIGGIINEKKRRFEKHSHYCSRWPW